MGNTGKKYIIVLILFALFAGIVNYLSYDTFNQPGDDIEVIEEIPHIIGNWKGKDLSLDASVYELLETKSIIHRDYAGGNTPVLLSVVYYPETKVDFHAPESCLGGKGIRTKRLVKQIQIRFRKDTISLDVNMLMREQGANEQMIYYFYKAGPFIGSSYIKLRFALAFNKFSSKKKSGSLIRVSTPVVQGNQEKASQTLIRFIEDLYPYVVKHL